MTDPATRQRVIDGLQAFRSGDAARRAGLTPAGYCAARLRTWAQRNGKPLSPAQAHVLACCERMQQTLQRDEHAPELLPADDTAADRAEARQRRVREYAEQHGLSLVADPGLQGAGA